VVDEPIAARHEAVIERLTEAAQRDERIAAAWLQGSRADGSADAFSDIDFYVAVTDEAFDAFDKLAFISQAARVLVHLDPYPGLTICLLEGPVKLDFMVEKLSRIADSKRPAAAMLVDKADLSGQLQTGWEPDEREIARRVDEALRVTFQGASWPVRLLRRGQWATYAYSEMMLIVGTIVPLLLVQRDRRAFVRNAMSRERLLTDDERREIHKLTNETLRALAAESLAEAYRAHVRICDVMGRVGRAACTAFSVAFPEAAEAEALRFFEREWPD
jgi:predicted nucleotidyltransferase